MTSCSPLQLALLVCRQGMSKSGGQTVYGGIVGIRVLTMACLPLLASFLIRVKAMPTCGAIAKLSKRNLGEGCRICVQPHQGRLR